jgi:hypothetical protein
MLTAVLMIGLLFASGCEDSELEPTARQTRSRPTDGLVMVFVPAGG